jgi:two-component system, sensor histidine kinase and response regulator
MSGTAFGLVMLDAEMPGMDGFAVAERLKENLDLAGATIMMHSAVIAGDLAVRCRQVGSNHVSLFCILNCWRRFAAF